MARSWPSELGASRPPSTSLDRPIAGDDAVDRVPLPQRVAQPLQDEHPRPFADDQAVGPGIERGRLARRETGRGAARSPSGCRAGRAATARRSASRRPGPRAARRPPASGRRATRRTRRRACRPPRPAPAPGPRPPPAGPPRSGSAARSASASSRRGRRAAPRSVRPRYSRARADAVSVGRTMLPRTTPDPPAVEPLGHGVAPRLAAGVQRQVEHRVEPPEQLRVDVEPLGVEPEPLDEAAARRVDAVRARRPAGRTRRRRPAASGPAGPRAWRRPPPRCSPRTDPGRVPRGRSPRSRRSPRVSAASR